MSIDQSRSRPREVVPVVVIACLMIAPGFGEGRQLAAQEGGRRGVPEAALDSVGRRIQFFSPQSGPPGTAVTLRTGGMPPLTPMRIGMGATRFGFEELAQLLTDERGEFTVTVEVPSWAERQRPHVFIAFDFYFRPIALSDWFHVTGPDGTVLREGRISDEGVECPVLRGDDGVLYALAGEISGFDAGDQVVVEGTIAESSVCMQGTTIEVVRIRPGGPTGPVLDSPAPRRYR